MEGRRLKFVRAGGGGTDGCGLSGDDYMFRVAWHYADGSIMLPGYAGVENREGGIVGLGN